MSNSRARLQIPSAAFLGVVALPTVVVIAVVFSALLHSDNPHLAHLFEYVLPRTSFNTLRLAVAVLGLSAVFGTVSAWLTTRYRFPGRWFFDWALFLPMAVPGYVMAFSFSGLREALIADLHANGFSNHWVPHANNFLLVAMVLALVLYPYVYLMARSAFSTQAKRHIEVAESMGCSEREIFLRVALPIARPWIFAGLLLVLMETLADFGTVAIFNYDTFTTAIYKSWFDLYSVNTGLQLSTVLVVVVAMVIYLEGRASAAQRYNTRSAAHGETSSTRSLSPASAFLAVFFCSALFFLAFILPVLQLGFWATETLTTSVMRELTESFWTSMRLGLAAVLLVVGLAIGLTFIDRFARFPLKKLLLKVALLGYALPGTVLAIALFSAFAGMAFLLREFGVESRWLQGSFVLMLVAYMVRFMAVAVQPLQSNMTQVDPGIDRAAESLGAGPLTTYCKIHLPLLKTGLFTAALLVFVDVVKELPITLMTRPFGVNTLAIKIYEYSAEGLWEQAALPALAIIVLGLLPVYLLIRNVGNPS